MTYGTSDEVIQMMALAETAKRPLRRYQECVRQHAYVATDSDESKTIRRRGEDALREFRSAVWAWVARNPDPMTRPVLDPARVRFALERDDHMDLTADRVEAFMRAYQEAGKR